MSKPSEANEASALTSEANMSKLARLTVPLHPSEANDPRASEANHARALAGEANIEANMSMLLLARLMVPTCPHYSKANMPILSLACKKFIIFGILMVEP